MATSSTEAKVTLYWLEQSRSQRILWLLEELKVPYELKVFHRDPKTHFAPPELKEVHALGKSPVISVQGPGLDKPVVIAESGFITEYLLDHFSNGSTLLPKRYREGQEGAAGGETEEWLRYRYFLHYAEGSLMSFMMISMIVNQIKNAPVPFFIRPITSGIASKINSGFLDANFKTHFGFLENTLKTSGGDYLCGPHLTGADILLSFPLMAGKSRIPMLTSVAYPKLFAYIERLENEPGYKKAIEKVISVEGKFELLSF